MEETSPEIAEGSAKKSPMLQRVEQCPMPLMPEQSQN